MTIRENVSVVIHVYKESNISQIWCLDQFFCIVDRVKGIH